jgi:hypothetical protein
MPAKAKTICKAWRTVFVSWSKTPQMIAHGPLTYEKYDAISLTCQLRYALEADAFSSSVVSIQKKKPVSVIVKSQNAQKSAIKFGHHGNAPTLAMTPEDTRIVLEEDSLRMKPTMFMV